MAARIAAAFTPVFTLITCPNIVTLLYVCASDLRGDARQKIVGSSHDAIFPADTRNAATLIASRRILTSVKYIAAETLGRINHATP